MSEEEERKVKHFGSLVTFWLGTLLSRCFYVPLSVLFIMKTLEDEQYVVITAYKPPKIFSEKQKGFRDGLSYSTLQKSKETRGNAITQPRSHPIKKM